MNFCWFDGSTKASFELLVHVKLDIFKFSWYDASSEVCDLLDSLIDVCGNQFARWQFWKKVFLAIIFLFSLCFLFVLREPVRQVTVLKKVFLAINSYFSFSFLFVFTGTSLPGDSFEKIIFSDKLLFFFFLFVCFAGTSLAGDSFALEKYFWRLIFIFLGTFCLFCGNQFARWQFWIFFFIFLDLQYVWCVWGWSGSFFEHGADQMLS